MKIESYIGSYESDKEKPWHVSELDLNLGGEDDVWIKFKFFMSAEPHDSWMDIYANSDKPTEVSFVNIDLDAAVRLRDFLNYIVPVKSSEKNNAS